MNMSTAVDSIEHVVALTCLGRSGSVFLQSLFDGHPKVITTPGIAMRTFYERYSNWVSLPIEQLTDSFIDYYAILFDSRSPSPEWVRSHGHDLGLTRLGPDRNAHIEVDREEFRRQMIKHAACQPSGPLTRSWFFKAVHLCYQTCLTPDFVADEKTVIVYPLHQSGPWRGSRALEEDFPAAQFITAVREPVQSLNSWFRQNRSIGYHGLEAMLNGGFPVSSKSRQRCSVLKIEELNSDPQGCTKMICRRLNLEWQETMLQSTFCGLTWWGDSSSPVTGFAPAAASRSGADQGLTSTDQLRLKILMFRQLRQWKYAPDMHCPLLVYYLVALSLLFWPFSLEVEGALSLRRQSLERPRQSLSSVLKYLFALSGLKIPVYLLAARLSLFLRAMSLSRKEPMKLLSENRL